MRTRILTAFLLVAAFAFTTYAYQRGKIVYLNSGSTIPTATRTAKYATPLIDTLGIQSNARAVTIYAAGKFLGDSGVTMTFRGLRNGHRIKYFKSTGGELAATIGDGVDTTGIESDSTFSIYMPLNVEVLTTDLEITTSVLDVATTDSIWDVQVWAEVTTEF